MELVTICVSVFGTVSPDKVAWTTRSTYDGLHSPAPCGSMEDAPFSGASLLGGQGA